MNLELSNFLKTFNVLFWCKSPFKSTFFLFVNETSSVFPWLTKNPFRLQRTNTRKNMRIVENVKNCLNILNLLHKGKCKVLKLILTAIKVRYNAHLLHINSKLLQKNCLLKLIYIECTYSWRSKSLTL